jgi:putative ABC transport system permease protein
VFRRLRNTISGTRLEKNLDEEISFHLEKRIEECIARGMPAEEARLKVLRRFGNATLTKERTRDMDTVHWIETAARDTRYALRMLRRNPGFTVVAVLALALGIGANTAIFSVVNSVLMRPLPFEDPDRLVLLWGNVLRTNLERRGASLPDFLDWRSQSGSFEGMAAWWEATFTLYGKDEPEHINGEVVSPGYLSLLGIEPAIGRRFRAEEDVGFSAPPVVLISHGMWIRRFGADPSLNGKTLTIDQRPHTIIGVLPAGFRGLSDRADIWVPPSSLADIKEIASERGGRWFSALARLKSGVSSAQAQAEMNAICKSLERAYPDTNEKRGVEIASLTQETVGDLRPALLVIMGAVGFVLLIACTNVANLLLARAESRQHEIAIRAAIGASRGRLIRQLLTESVVLSFVGAALGMLMSIWGVKALMLASPVSFPSFVNPRLDLRVALFTILISLAAGIAVGLAPAVHATPSRLLDALKGASNRSGDTSRRRRFRDTLVVAEVALVIVLLIGAGLLIRSFLRLTALDPGFNPEHLLSLRINLPGVELLGANAAQQSREPAADQRAAPQDMHTVTYARTVAERMQSLPGVQSVALGTDIPLSGDSSAILYTAEGQAPVTAQNVPRAYRHRVTPGFFATLGIPVLRGRDFLPSETGVAIVSENVIRRFWPGQDPIGKRFKTGRTDSKAAWTTIVGVVGEVKYRGLPSNPTADPDIYFPFAESTRAFALFLRVGVDPSSLAPVLRSELHSVDKSMTVYDATPMRSLVAAQTARSQFTSWITGIFSATALLLAIIGIYGVMVYTVTRRTREFGIRMALGASCGDVFREVLGRGLTLVGVGLFAGIAAALAVTRWLEILLYGIRYFDLFTYFGVAVLVGTVALAAMYFPARHAAHADPVVALRNE